MAFLSFSIDLCGSTRIKQELVEISQGDVATRKALYQRYLALLFKIERDLYSLLSESSVIDLKNLYLVKQIGDEFWFFYDVGPDENEHAKEIALTFIHYLLELLVKERFISFHDNTKHSMKDHTGLYTFDLPLKIYVDLINEATELSALRYEFLKDIIQDFTHKPSEVVYKMDADALGICHQLNLCTSASPDGSNVFSRPDFIGLEIDRFFRLTQKCFPQLLTLGETLQSLLNMNMVSLHEGHRKIQVKSTILKTGKHDDNLFIIPRIVDSMEMKGLSHDYTIYYIFNRNVFKNALVAPETGIESLLDETRSFLARCGFYAVKS